MSRKLLMTVLLVVGILVVITILHMPRVSRATTNIPPGLLATKAPIDPYIDEIKAFQKELQRTDLPTESRGLIEGKLNIVSIEATRRAEGRVNSPTRPAILPPPPTTEGPFYTAPDGIDNNPPIPISQAVVTILNSWRKTTDDRYYLVYAGFLTQDSQQGTILVLQPGTHTFIQFDTPGYSGGVTVIADTGTTIILQSTEGTLYYFDAAKEQFIDANGTPVPTNTSLPPTSTPIISPTPTPNSPYP